MSLGANFSSGYTQDLQDKGILKSSVSLETCVPCKTYVSGPQPAAQYSSMALLGKTCPSPSPSDLALFPKVAIQSSMLTQGLLKRKTTDPLQRFAQYTRYTPPVPCQPLPPTMAGISEPSKKRC